MGQASTPRTHLAAAIDVDAVVSAGRLRNERKGRHAVVRAGAELAPAVGDVGAG